MVKGVWQKMAALPVFRSFVSEKEIEEVKQKRQEEWEKVRKPDQPLGKLQKLVSLIKAYLYVHVCTSGPWRSIDLSLILIHIERPEEAYDPRTLYDRLKQQKDKKQEEHDDQYKFSEFSTIRNQWWCV